MKQIINEIRFRILIWAIKQWSEHEMDQWEAWKTDTKYGDLYITLSRSRASEWPSAYVKV